jgi:hypothetical protein
MWFQCRLRRGNAETVAWIEQRGAQKGYLVQLLTADKELWRVVEVYRPGLPEAIMKNKQNLDRGSLSSLVDA